MATSFMNMSSHKPVSTGIQSRTRLPMTAIHLMFFSSGVAALICQVVWFKQLQFILGSSTFAVSVTISSFFLGLSLGSWQGGRWADRWSRPLRRYAIMECGVGLAVIAITFVLSTWSYWAVGIAPFLGSDNWASGLLTVSLATCILLIPTVLMGAAMPLLAKYLVREQKSLAERIGYLYAVNTLGAACGCMIVGLLLIGLLGVFQSALVGAFIYLAVAAAAWRLDVVLNTADDSEISTSTSISTSKNASATESTAIKSDDSSATESGTGILVAVFALSGFTAIAYEVLWFRVLANFSLHTVYAFSGMLATYLFGLVIGSLICAKFLAPQKDKLLGYFAQVQLLIGVAGIVCLALLGRSRNIIEFVVQSTNGISGGFLHDQMAQIADVMLFCFAVLGLPTILIGISFPLVSELTIHHVGAIGSKLGKLYALNTLGGTIGSLVAGFLMLPLLGSQWSLTIIIGLNILAFLILIVTQTQLRNDSDLWRLGGISAAVGVAGLFVLGPNYLRDAQTQYEGADLLEFVEANDATFTVLGYHSPEIGDYQQLLVNGRSYANNALPGRRYMNALAHLPTFLHSNPENCLVACIGTGTTVGSLTTHPSLTNIFAVDLSQEVFDVAPHFEPINHGFHENEHVYKIATDARHFLLTERQQYDVITFEPPPPNDTGVVNLYSREFYALAKNRMSDDGVIAQWMPLDLTRKVLPRMMIRSMMEEFPHVSLWISNRMEGIAIGSMRPLNIDLDNWRERMQVPAVRADLAAVGVHSAEDLAAMFLMAGDTLKTFVGPVPSVTDNHPRIEYHNLYRREKMTCAEFMALQEPVEKYFVAQSHDPETLSDAKKVMTAILLEHEATSGGDHVAARGYLDTALRAAPENSYLRYLSAVNQNSLTETSPVSTVAPKRQASESEID